MQRKFVFSEGEYYHLYNRGVEKRRIFLHDADRKRFTKLLYVANGEKPFVFRDIQDKQLEDIDRGEPLVALGAYVLMPNHFHLLVKEIKPGGISTYMEKLLTGYSSYFNKKHQRVGSLFQGTFKGQHVINDKHLKYLFAYIHLNPIKCIDKNWRQDGIADLAAAKHFLASYRYSSYLAYAGVEKLVDPLLEKSVFPEYFSAPQSFDNFLDDFLSLNSNEI